MKKLSFLLAALLFTGVAFGEKKCCKKGASAKACNKEAAAKCNGGSAATAGTATMTTEAAAPKACCKKSASAKACCKKEAKAEVKAATATPEPAVK